MSTPPLPGRWPEPGTVVEKAFSDIKFVEMLLSKYRIKQNLISRGHSTKNLFSMEKKDC
jgi:hypothetical protein